MSNTPSPAVDEYTGGLRHVAIVLVEPSHPGNIGATARAMKTMGLRTLRLVNPREFPSPVANARASGADDLLTQARCFGSLAEALADCGFVAGTTARARYLEGEVHAPRDIAAHIAALPPATASAIVFGREQSGLTNQELAHCHQVIRIPTDAEFSSLNIAQAVQICAYEVRLACVSARHVDNDEPLATALEKNQALAHVQEVMELVDFFDPRRPKLLPLRLQRLLNRADLKRSEIRILRGFLAAVQSGFKR